MPNPPEYDANKYYLRKQSYHTKSGGVKISYSLIPRTARSNKRGPAFQVNLALTQTDYNKIANLRRYNAPWKNIANDYNTSAYHIKKLYESYNVSGA